MTIAVHAKRTVTEFYDLTFASSPQVGVTQPRV
jgi:hypothetical protein